MCVQHLSLNGGGAWYIYEQVGTRRRNKIPLSISKAYYTARLTCGQSVCKDRFFAIDHTHTACIPMPTVDQMLLLQRQEIASDKIKKTDVPYKNGWADSHTRSLNEPVVAQLYSTQTIRVPRDNLRKKRCTLISYLI